MKQILCLALLLLLSVHTFSAYASPDETVSDVIVKMKESNAKIHDMQCLFVKSIVKNGKQLPPATMSLKYLKEPETIYIEFLDRYKGRKCLYVKGENNGKIVVRVPGLMKFIRIKMDPRGKQAMEEDIDPMTNMGFGSVIDSVEQWYQISLTAAGFKADLLKDTPVDGGVYHLITIGAATEQDGYLHLYVDRDTYLPYRVSYRLEDNSAVYTYKNLQSNTNLSRDDLSF